MKDDEVRIPPEARPIEPSGSHRTVGTTEDYLRTQRRAAARESGEEGSGVGLPPLLEEMLAGRTEPTVRDESRPEPGDRDSADRRSDSGRDSPAEPTAAPVSPGGSGGFPWRRALAVVLLAVVVVSALGLWWLARRIHSMSTISPVPEPEGSVLQYQETPPSAPRFDGPAPWEQRARADQDAAFDLTTFLDPPLEYRPLTRWWWPGNLVDQEQLLRELEDFAAAGFGGVEIQAFGINLSEEDVANPAYEDPATRWDSPSYYANLRAVLRRAEQLGLVVDLNNGSGWPTGGRHIAMEDNLRTLMHGELFVPGSSSGEESALRELVVDLPEPRFPVQLLSSAPFALLTGGPTALFLPEHRELVAVLAARVSENARNRNPFDLTDQVTVDPSSVIELTQQVQGSAVRFTLPNASDDWVVVAFWQMPGGEFVTADAIPEPSWVVDHLDAERIRANQDYLYRKDTGLEPWFGTTLRAFFNDSLEFKQERHWARGMLEEFEARRGYDPRPYLLALPEAGADYMWFHAAGVHAAPEYELGEVAERFREDWGDVLSELFLERFFDPSQQWARERGLAHRSQGYGASIHVLEAAGRTDLPETEQLYAGGSELFLKAVSSGAHLYDRPLTSAESFVFAMRAFTSTPAKLRALADKALGSGIQQVIYHGSAYGVLEPEARGYPAEGWYPWILGMFSTDFSEPNPYFAQAAVLNRYIARMQYLLRLGRPETDVLVLYPGGGFPQGFSNPGERFIGGDFHGEPDLELRSATAFALGLHTEPGADRRGEWMRALWSHLRELESQGLQWEWVDERSLRAATFDERTGWLQAGALRARGTVLFEHESLRSDTAEALAALADQGLPVQVVGDAPARQRGVDATDQGDVRVQRAMERVAGSSGAIAALPEGAVRFEDEKAQALRRRLEDGSLIVFLRNPDLEERRLEVEVASDLQQGVWLDAWTGERWPAERSVDGSFSVRLPGLSSRVLVLSPQIEALEGDTRERWRRLADAGSLGLGVALRNWEVSAGEVSVRSADLFDWRSNEDLRSSAEVGVYRTTFDWQPPQDGGVAVLDLGWMSGTARVRLNGAELGEVVVFPFRIELSEQALRRGENELEIEFTPPLRNQIARRVEAGTPGYGAASLLGGVTRMATGILGPVEVLFGIEGMAVEE